MVDKVQMQVVVVGVPVLLALVLRQTLHQ